MRAIVVTPSLDWRLHGFDLLSEHQPATGFEWPLMAATWMVGAQYKPAEVCRFVFSSWPLSVLMGRAEGGCLQRQVAQTELCSVACSIFAPGSFKALSERTARLVKILGSLT